MAPLRFPTAAELEQGFAIQCAEDYQRSLHPRPPEPRDQDVREADAPRVPAVFCQTCGKVFDYATKGMAVLQRMKHERKAHPESVEAY